MGEQGNVSIGNMIEIKNLDRLGIVAGIYGISTKYSHLNSTSFHLHG